MNLDRKTTVAGAVAVLSQLCKTLGIDIPPYVWDTVSWLAVFVLAYFTNKQHAPEGDKK